MALAKAQITTEATDTTEATTRGYDNRLNIDTTLPYPVINNDYCTGQLVAIQYEEATGEVVNTRDGRSFTKSSDQLLFVLQVEAENTLSGTLELKFWTNITADGVKNEDGSFSKLTRLLIALGVVEAKTLNNRSRIQFDLNSLGGETFRFKVEQKGRIWKPLIDTIQHIDDASETALNIDLKDANKAKLAATA